MTSKVFVGNLAFKTTDQQLVEAFQEFGKVKSGVVITRGRRSLGYGFVEFESHDAALQAVKTKNGNPFNERPIKVELATDNPVRAERPANTAVARTSNTAATSTAKYERSDATSNGGEGAAPRRRAPRRRRNTRKEGGPSDNKSAGTTTSGVAPSKSDNTQPNRRRRRRRTNNKSQDNEDRVLSNTSVFVANLPFGVNDDELKAFFAAHNPKAAHVVVTRNGRSRGYGFVEFSNEKDQKAAIDGKNGQDFPKDDVKRPITVTPSYKTQEITAEK